MSAHKINRYVALYRGLDKWFIPPRTEPMLDADIELLCSIEEADLNELDKRCYDYTFAALILRLCGKHGFYEVLDILKARVPNAVFRWLIDYDGKRMDGRNPIDRNFSLTETFDVIDRYYDSQYKLIYSFCSCREDSIVDEIISKDKKNGINIILKALGNRVYTKDQFDIQVLKDIWSDYYGEWNEEYIGFE